MRLADAGLMRGVWLVRDGTHSWSTGEPVALCLITARQVQLSTKPLSLADFWSIEERCGYLHGAWSWRIPD